MIFLFPYAVRIEKVAIVLIIEKAGLFFLLSLFVLFFPFPLFLPGKKDALKRIPGSPVLCRICLRQVLGEFHVLFRKIREFLCEAFLKCPFQVRFRLQVPINPHLLCDYSERALWWQGQQSGEST